MSNPLHISEILYHYLKFTIMGKKNTQIQDATFTELTASEITEKAIKYFTSTGYNVWRQNNLRVPGRNFNGKLGLPDIIGFATQFSPVPGTFFAGEVKKKGDTLSDEQKQFLREVNAAGGFGYLIEDDGMGGIKYRLYTDKK